MLAILKRVGTLVFGAGLAMSMSVANAAPEFTLKLHHLLGPKAPAHTKMLMPCAERIEKGTKGRVKIEIYPAMSLGGKPPELIRQVQDGVVDIVWTVNGYTAGLFPRSEVFELPFIHTNNAVATNLAILDLYGKYLKDDYKSVQVMFNHVHAGQAIHMVDTIIRKPADLAGKKLRIPTRTGAWIIQALGANPVGMPVPALPQALSKKVVDGALIPWEIIPPLKLQELTKYQIEGINKTRFGTTVFQVSMNKGTWAKLPADVQKVFSDNSGRDWVREVGEIWTAAEEFGIGLAKKAGNEHVTLSQAETDAFRKTLEPVVQRWVDEVAKKGIDGNAMVKAAREAIAKHSK